MKLATPFLCSLSALAALYASDDHITLLTADEFRQRFKADGETGLVEFFSTGCHHCVAMADQFKMAAKALKGITKVYAVEDRPLRKEEGVRGVPHIKWYADGSGEQFKGERTASAFVDFVLSQIKDTASKRLDTLAGAPSKKEPMKPKMEESTPKKPKMEESTPNKGRAEKDGEVVVLTSKNFDELVMKDEEYGWFVEFYAPWCGHCKALAPKWSQLAKELKDRVKVAKVDATVESQLASKFKVRGYPTLVLLPPGKKSYQNYKEYQEAREVKDMMNFALKNSKGGKIVVSQILHQADFNRGCNNDVCIIAFLPNMLDSSVAERNRYIDVLRQVGKAQAGDFNFPIRLFWIEAGNSLEFEEQLQLRFGWPAVIAINKTKQVYSIHRGGFTTEAISDFVTGIGTGRTTSDPLPENLAMLKRVPAWDGKEATKKEEL